MKKGSLRGIATVVLLSLALTSCGLLPQEEELPQAPVVPSYQPPEYRETTVKRGRIEKTQSARCEYLPAKEVGLGFAMEGEIIEKIYVTQGQTVKAGQILAELTQKDLKEKITAREYQVKVLNLQKEHLLLDWALEASRSNVQLKTVLENLEQTRTKMARLRQWQLQGERAEAAEGSDWLVENPPVETMEQLVEEEKQLLSRRDTLRKETAPDETYQKQLTDLEDSLKIEEMYLSEMRAELAKRQIVASISGTITYVSSQKEGDLSSKEMDAFRISDMNSTAFIVTGSNATIFPVGTKVMITYSGTEHPAVSVKMVEKTAGKEAEAHLVLEQPDPLLKSGDSGSVRLVMEFREDVLYVESKAIQSTGESKFVYVLDENGFKMRKDVTCGMEGDRYTEIVDGLSEGDRVVVEG